MRCCRLRLSSSLKQIKANRQRVAQQFGTLDGWQPGKDQEFDQYVSEKRRAAYFDAFDQRVERGYQRMLKLHKAEVWNAHKRRLRSSGQKLTAQVLTDIKANLQEREEWLRDVFSQIDADYRCDDENRQEKAAAEITRALSGEPGDFMEWLYERRQQRRFLGEKGKAELGGEDESDHLPPVSDEEVNRYAALRVKMSEVEEAVVAKFGPVGLAHWKELQQQKDVEYSEKLEAAAAKYKELLKQQEKYDESTQTEHMKYRVRRAHTAQLRFKSSMEMEEERERLVEAHREMQKERQEKSKAARRQSLQLASELRAAGKTSAEVAAMLRSRQLDEMIQDHTDSVRCRQEAIVQKKHTFLDMIDQMRQKVEEREGNALMGLGGAGSGADDLQQPAGGEATSPSAGMWEDAKELAKMRGDQSASSRKKALWDILNEEKYKDPALAVHQARLDARKTYDPLYMLMDPIRLAQERHQWNRGYGEQATGSGTERQMLKDPEKVMLPYQWGMSGGHIQDLDRDGKTKYVHSGTTGGVHVMDPATMDIDLRFERKGPGHGPVWNGPKFYKMGADQVNSEPIKKT